MTNVQFFTAIGVPIFANTAMFGLFAMYLDARLDAFQPERP